MGTRLNPKEYLAFVFNESIRLFAWELEYTPITTNLYKNKPKKRRLDNKYDCEANEACLVECNETCGNGAFCTNNTIRNGLNAIALEVCLTPSFGRGVFALQFIPEKTKIVEYVGEIITKTEAIKRLDAQGDAPNYIMKTRTAYIDANKYGNISRFINHSCDPNCHVEEWYVDNLPRVIVVAIKSIQIGEQLTFNYGANGDWSLVCKCGSKNCKKII